ncbi:3-deoxy-manno-octulosonate cytidylyltransferase [Alteromonas sp. BMJM2]|uniref:3-deoxy-manno-octulosonate cytidylyltransferase n=1 Tax=Alteromonas sp. BMJM2 TaxID=2954241 RepID=UPI0022B476BF|nr:3-deoxy-manno-octulosonate cytidylyltransferase [Alteromonas sp. BMJM2]
MKTSHNFAVVIPARYKSTRFPGKPLVDICGQTMVQHVWERCCSAVGVEKVYVATDDLRIESEVRAFGGQVLLTSDSCLTGTDRLAEANKQLDCDFIVNVQGDEPLIEPTNILKVIEKHLRTGNVTNAYCSIESENEHKSLNVPKVVCSLTEQLLYMSRAPIPLTKGGQFSFGYKQVCIYAFSREQLNFFSSHKEKTPLENIEDIEILRFLEAGYHIDMVRVSDGSLAVDVPADVVAVTKKIEENKGAD